MTITEFLTARLDEDEATARAAIDPERPGTHWQWVLNHDDTLPVEEGEDRMLTDPSFQAWVVSLRTVEQFPTPHVGDLPAFALPYVEEVPGGVAAHIARHDLARVLADVAAKRAIVALHSASDGRDPLCSSIDYPEVAEDCETLRAMLQPFADHPDYDKAWRV